MTLSDPWILASRSDIDKQLPFIRNPIAEEVIAGVKGNAPREVKEAPIKALQSLHGMPGLLFNTPVSGRLTVSEVSIAPSLDDITKTDCRIFYKINVTGGAVSL